MVMKVITLKNVMPLKRKVAVFEEDDGPKNSEENESADD